MRVGQRYVAKTNLHSHSAGEEFYIHEIYYHDGVQSDVAIMANIYDNRQEHIIMHDLMLYWILKSIKPPKTEIEWLDRVQENFKHG